jgi:hypothetical protein
MKKLLSGCLLLCSVGAYAEETHELPPIQGWWPDTQSFSSLVSGVVQPQVNNGMTPYGTNWSMVSHAQMAAAQAAGKQAAKKGCLAESQEKADLADQDLTQRMNDSYLDCRVLFAHEPDAMAVCNLQVYDHFEGKAEGLEEDQKIRDEYCEKTYGK